MINFEEDYKTHKFIIDYSTKNLSFVRMSSVLKRMGVSNNKFMLVLTQPELQGVDPHSKNLTQDQMIRIAYECKVNPWYFFREVIRIPSAGGDPVYYKLNRANLALIWLFLNNVDIFLTMPRQIGKTIGTIGLIVYMMYIVGENLNIGLFAKGTNLRQENVDRLKELRNCLPSYLYKKGPKFNTDNQEGLEYKALKNKYITFVSQSDKKTAMAQGRGQSHGFQHWDEMAYYTNNNLSYEAASSATNTAMEQVRKAGIPCSNIITTTAGRLSDPWGRYAHSIKSDCIRFSEKLYDCINEEDLHNVVKVGSGNQMVYLEFSYKQLGKTEEWFKRVTRGKSPDVIACDFLNQWIHGAGDSIIPKDMLDKLKQHSSEPVACTFLDSLLLRWYVNPELMDREEFRQIPFIIAADTSDNIGRDFTTLVMINPTDMSVVMTCRCNQTNLAYIAKCIVKLMQKHTRSILIPERNKNGAMLIDLILHAFEEDYHFDPFSRIFNTYVQNYTSSSPSFKTLDIANGNVRKAFGFNTTSSATSRKLLYTAVLSTAVNNNYNRIFDTHIIDEICTLTVKNGRIDHETGGHDDTLISYLIACYFVMYGKNLHMYGIQPHEILKENEDPNDDPFERDLQNKIKIRIAQIEETLDKNVSPMLKITLENELGYLRSISKSEADNMNVISIQQIQKQSSEKKKAGLDIGVLNNTLQLMGMRAS